MYEEKKLIKYIELDEENYLKFILCYNSQYQIILDISKFYHKKDEYFAYTEGSGKRTILERILAKRKNLNKLIEYTKQLDNKTLLDIIPILGGGNTRSK